MNCARCGHSEKDHCKGNERHGWWTDVKKQTGIQPRIHLCKTRHCNQPLCSCIDFQKEVENAVPKESSGDDAIKLHVREPRRMPRVRR